jgi:hypothetical protein
LHLRYFIHPDMEEHLAEVIKKYGPLIKDGGYKAMPTSSPRSLAIWDVRKPELVFGMKVSLNRKIGNVRRVNAWDKLTRSHAVNNVMAAISASDLIERQFSFMPESAQIETPGVEYGNILRELPMGKGATDRIYLAGFSLASKGPEGEAPVLMHLIKNSGEEVQSFISEKILTPLVRSYAYLVWRQGLLGEPHQQNLLFELQMKKKDLPISLDSPAPNDPLAQVGAKALLTGKVIYRDMDAFRPDPELRMLVGEDMAPFLHEQNPSKHLKLNQAMNFIDISYSQYLRNDWCFLIETSLRRHAAKLGIQLSGFQFTKIWEEMDRLLLLESINLLGIRDSLGLYFDKFVNSNLERLKMEFKSYDWTHPEEIILSKRDAEQLTKMFSLRELFPGYIPPATKKGSQIPLQEIIDNLKRKKIMSAIEESLTTSNEQALLRREFERLVFNRRATTEKTPGENAKFIYSTGAIAAYSKSGILIGVAFMEPKSAMSKNFYENIPYPRKQPSHDFKAVWRLTPTVKRANFNMRHNSHSKLKTFKVDTKSTSRSQISCEAIF